MSRGSVSEDVIHDIGWWSLGCKLSFHKFHVRSHVLEELIIAFTKIVQAWLIVLIP